MTTIQQITELIKTVVALSNSLPKSIPSATTKDKIYIVLNTAEGATTFETFNRHFDALFGEDCRNSEGRLHHIRQGKIGMGLVCSYLNKIDWSDVDIPLDLVEKKLVRLNTELTYLKAINGIEPPISTRPSRHKQPTFKLRDTDNTEQAELSFQRQAVHEFHTRQEQVQHQSSTTLAQPLEHPLPIPPSCPVVSQPIVSQPTVSQQKRTIEEETDRDEDSDASVRPSMCSNSFYSTSILKSILLQLKRKSIQLLEIPRLLARMACSLILTFSRSMMATRQGLLVKRDDVMSINSSILQLQRKWVERQRCTLPVNSAQTRRCSSMR